MRKFLVTLALAWTLATSMMLWLPAEPASACAVVRVNARTGEAECRTGQNENDPTATPGSSERSGSGATEQGRAPTLDETLVLFRDPLTRSDLRATGALTTENVAAQGRSPCVVSDTGAHQWNGNSWVDVGDLCPLDGGRFATPPRLSPAQAAAVAIARVRFTSAAPGAGPNRSINKLPFDVPVGYPVWFWAEGGTTAPRSATDSVDGRAVTLTVRFDHVTWDAGDGSPVLRCGVGTKWGPSSQPGAGSPTCGHTYQRMGDYTITATTHWTIAWEVDGVTGSEAYSLSQQRPWAVGELQVLVR